MLANLAFAIPAPYMPLELKRKNVNDIWIGLIFTAYPIAIVFFSPFVPGIIAKHGRKLPITLGLFMMGTAFIGLSLLESITSTGIYIYMHISLRILQGISSNLVQTTMYSISAYFYKEHQEAFLGYLQVMTGLGIALGPPVGSLFYILSGYNAVFYGAGLVMILYAMVLR